MTAARPARLRIVVLGIMGRCPFGGQTWLYLNWLRALERAGHEVWYVEDDTVWPYDPERETVTDDPAFAVRHIGRCLERIGSGERWAFRAAFRDDRAAYGPAAGRIDELYRTCDALVNLVGATDLREEHMRAPLRVYVETDPVTAQLRLDGGDAKTAAAFAKHDRIVTYGENYGAPDCGVPLGDVRYGKTRQPVDLELWPYAFDPAARDFTTIGNYRQTGTDAVWRGETYFWSKHHEWEKFVDLPRRAPGSSFRLAVWPPDPADRALLQSHGWRLEPPLEMSLDSFGRYPEFFRRSRGAFTVAKDQNIRLRSGWFSEREAAYLASGKPVIAQDTAFGCAIRTGAGLFAFRTMEDILEALARIERDYEAHCRAARAVAEEFFEAGAVGRRFLGEIGLA